eukprot:SAG11_NODE_701_length_7670_cov_22.897107_3_plen_38_part_00
MCAPGLGLKFALVDVVVVRQLGERSCSAAAISEILFF